MALIAMKLEIMQINVGLIIAICKAAPKCSCSPKCTYQAPTFGQDKVDLLVKHYQPRIDDEWKKGELQVIHPFDIGYKAL